MVTHGVDGEQCFFELFGFGQMVEQLRNRRNFISLLFSGTLIYPRIGGIGAQRMKRLEPLALVVGVARSLAVDGGEIMPTGPHLLDPVLETAREQHRIETIDQRPQPARTRNPKIKRRKLPEKIYVMLAPAQRFHQNRRYLRSWRKPKSSSISARG